MTGPMLVENGEILFTPEKLEETREKEGKIIKIKTDGETRLDVQKDYNGQKLKEFFIKSLSYGIDPEILLRKNALAVWNSLDSFDNVTGIVQETNLSEKSVRKFLRIFSDFALIKFKKKKPIINNQSNR